MNKWWELALNVLCDLFSLYHGLKSIFLHLARCTPYHLSFNWMVFWRREKEFSFFCVDLLHKSGFDERPIHSFVPICFDDTVASFRYFCIHFNFQAVKLEQHKKKQSKEEEGKITNGKEDDELARDRKHEKLALYHITNRDRCPPQTEPSTDCRHNVAWKNKFKCIMNIFFFLLCRNRNWFKPLYLQSETFQFFPSMWLNVVCGDGIVLSLDGCDKGQFRLMLKKRHREMDGK